MLGKLCGPVPQRNCLVCTMLGLSMINGYVYFVSLIIDHSDCNYYCKMSIAHTHVQEEQFYLYICEFLVNIFKYIEIINIQLLETSIQACDPLQVMSNIHKMFCKLYIQQNNISMKHNEYIQQNIIIHKLVNRLRYILYIISHHLQKTYFTTLLFHDTLNYWVVGCISAFLKTIL